MDAPPSQRSSANLFQVYLRLRPPPTGFAPGDRFLTVEEPQDHSHPTHITLNPPNDRKRSTEKFAFTQVFEEDATQLDVFHCTGVAPLVEGVLAPHGGEGSDALLATLGVTGSGKTHTILGSRTQRGMTQLALDVMFRSIGSNMLNCATSYGLDASIQASDASEASVMSAPNFLETVYADFAGPSRAGSRAATPMIVGTPQDFLGTSTPISSTPRVVPLSRPSPKSIRMVPSSPKRCQHKTTLPYTPPGFKKTPKQVLSPLKHFMCSTTAARIKNVTKTSIKGEHVPPPTPRRLLQRSSVSPQSPDISSVNVSSDPSAEYVVVLSMYEVYNDKIYDLLTPPIKSNATKEYRRRPLLFKSTENSADRKVVAGLRKIICSNFNEAVLVLEAGLHERQVAGTGSNSVSSRSHGFFCVEVKKRIRSRKALPWSGSTLTIVDLAGSERARDAKTQGATLAEAGKINESLMYLGQCLQAQSGSGTTSKPSMMPFRQCKMTELLFSNSFSASSSSYTSSVSHRRNSQKGVMIVTADAHGDLNATSQILRYSALAREVTIPRIPSITSTILATPVVAPQQCSSPISPGLVQHHRPFLPPGSGSHRSFSPTSPGEGDRVIMEHAALEIARMQEEINNLQIELDCEREARVTAEAHLLSMEDRLIDLEQAVREDCVAQFEDRFDIEMARWKASLAVEQERGEEHWDRKIDAFERGLGVGADADFDENEDKENVLIENLEQENERLRRELGVLKRELTCLSPSKRMPLQERDDSGARNAEVGSLGRRMERMRVSNESIASGTSAGSPKKVRKLVTQRWEDAMDGDDMF